MNFGIVVSIGIGINNGTVMIEILITLSSLGISRESQYFWMLGCRKPNDKIKVPYYGWYLLKLFSRYLAATAFEILRFFNPKS